MPSTPESNLRLELQATGENATTWGTKTNSNLELLSQAIAGAANVDVGGSGNYTLVASNYASDEARAATLVLTGTLTGNRDVIVPTTPKHYTVLNQTTGAFTLTIRQSAGTGVAIPSGSTLLVCTSTTCVDVNATPWQLCEAVRVVSGVAQADFSLPASFRRFRLTAQNIRPDAASRNLGLRFSTDGGATFVAGVSYVYYGISAVGGAANPFNQGGAGTGYLTLALGFGGNFQSESVAEIFPGNATQAASFRALVNGNGGVNWYVGLYGAACSVASAANAIRVYTNDGSTAGTAAGTFSGVLILEGMA